MTERQLEAKQTARRNLKSASTAHHCQAQTHLCAGKPNKIKTMSKPRTGLSRAFIDLTESKGIPVFVGL
jgi:hypothetical protein